MPVRVIADKAYHCNPLRKRLGTVASNLSVRTRRIVFGRRRWMVARSGDTGSTDRRAQRLAGQPPALGGRKTQVRYFLQVRGPRGNRSSVQQETNPCGSTRQSRRPDTGFQRPFLSKITDFTTPLCGDNVLCLLSFPSPASSQRLPAGQLTSRAVVRRDDKMKMDTDTLSPPRNWPDTLGKIFQGIQHDDCLDLAAQIAFYFSLSLFPFCLVLAAIVGLLPSTAVWQSFVTWIVTYLPTDSQHVIFSTILGLVNHSTGFLSLGLATSIWGASSGFMSLMESLTQIYGGQDRRPYWRKQLLAIFVTLLAMMFALAIFGLQAFGHWGYRWFSAELWYPSHGLWESSRWIVTLLVLCFAIDLVNFTLPDMKRTWHWITPGTAFVVSALVADSALSNLYFQHFSFYPRIYGTLGGFIVLMIWIYITSFVVLVGAEIDREFEHWNESTAG